MSRETVETAGRHPSCEAVLALVFEFLDQELPSDVDTRVREHLAVCAGCRGAFEHDRAFLRRLQRTGEGKASGELRQLIVERLSRRESTGKTQ